MIELMIVIAIIGILIGVGIPAWKMIVRRGNETAAIKQLQTVREAEADYAMGHRGDYGSFDQLAKDHSLDDDRFVGDAPVVSGYIYTIKITPKSATAPATYSGYADPQQSDGIGATGHRHFYIDPNVSNVRTNDTQQASASDPTIVGAQ